MIMAVLSVTFRFSKNMATKKVLYQIPDGCLINHFLRRRVCDEKRYIFRELNNVSLRKVILILLTAVLGPMTVITVELLTTSSMNLGAEEFLTPLTASFCTRVQDSASAFILVVAMTMCIMILCF